MPPDRWVFPWAGSDAHDTPFVSNRRDFHSSPAIHAAGHATLRLAGVFQLWTVATKASVDEVEMRGLMGRYCPN